MEPYFGSPAGVSHALHTSLPRLSTEERHQRAMFPTIPPDPEQILVGMLLPIGDTLLATPALAALRRRYPWAKITALVSQSNAGILQDNPNIDTLLFVTERGPEPRVKRFARGLSDLRQSTFDLVINFSPAGEIVLRIAGRYRKPLRVEMPLLWWLFGGHSEEYRLRHAVDHYLAAVEPILDRPLTDEERQPRLYLTAHDRSAARRFLRQLGLSPANMLVTMHVGGEGFNGRKRWAPERFAAVANHLIAKVNAHVLLIGGKEDVPLATEVAALIPQGATMIAGRTSLKETGALIEMSALFIGNDSCPLHIAAAVGTAAVGVFGPSNYQQFAPVGKRNYRYRLVRADLPCSPCFHFVGNDAPWVPNTCYSFACLKAVTPRMVVDAAIELLEDTRDD
jgi:ADP-heptose:LPS heptosyltransferase